MRIFAVSDIHGHYTELKKALDNAGFDSGDPNHILICCGDCFDRGYENRKVLEYLQSLERKILIRGNHEDILEKVITSHRIDQLDIYNGTDITVSELFGDENIDRRGYIDFSSCTDTVNEISKFIDSMYDFYETENHIFTHAWLPIERNYDTVSLLPDKEYAESGVWREARYTEWYLALEADLTISGKTIVCGHRASCNAYRIDNSRDPDDHSMFVSESVAAIDSSTVRTRRVNVYITEDKFFDSKKHFMSLKGSFFDLVQSGKKSVEIRLFDQKCQALSIGDTIEFSCADTPNKKIERRIVGLHRYYDIKSLRHDFPAEKLGYTLTDIERLESDISQTYTSKEIEERGLLAIRLANIK